jgi:hypothetical protein
MDVIRQQYDAYYDFGSGPQLVRWFPAAEGAKIFEGGHKFMSAVWVGGGPGDKDTRLPWLGQGEIFNPPPVVGKYVPSRIPPGQEICGPREWFVNGCPPGAPGLPRDHEGLALCCLTPIVSAIVPNRGAAEAANPVTVKGSFFHGATEVDVGGEPLLFTVVSDSEITTSIPAGPDQSLDVTVTTLAGKSATTAADVFTRYESMCGIGMAIAGTGNATALPMYGQWDNWRIPFPAPTTAGSTLVIYLMVDGSTPITIPAPWELIATDFVTAEITLYTVLLNNAPSQVDMTFPTSGVCNWCLLGVEIVNPTVPGIDRFKVASGTGTTQSVGPTSPLTSTAEVAVCCYAVDVVTGSFLPNTWDTYDHDTINPPPRFLDMIFTTVSDASQTVVAAASADVANWVMRLVTFR